MRKVVSLAGPGFISHESLELEKRSVLLEVKEYSLLLDSPDVLERAIDELSPSDLVFIRGHLFLTADDLLIARIAARKLENALRRYFQRNPSQRPKMFALGKAALTVLDILAPEEFRKWGWHRFYENLAPFVEASVYPRGRAEHTMFCGFSGTSVTLPAESLFKGWETFVRLHEDVVGWRLGNTYVSLLDVFGLTQFSQLDDFGYTEAKGFTGLQLLDLLISES